MHSFFMRSTIQKYVAEAVREARGEQGGKEFSLRDRRMYVSGERKEEDEQA